MNDVQFNGEAFKRLAPREIEVVRAAADGLSIKATADHLGIAKSTVQNYRGKIIWKLGSKNMAGAVSILTKGGII